MNAASSARCFLALLTALLCGAGVDATAQSPQTPMTRLQPIGSPSAVDRYTRAASRTETSSRNDQRHHRETAYQPSRRSETSSAIRTRQAPAHFRPASSGRAGSPDRAASGRVRRAVFQQTDRDPVTAPQLPSGGMSFPGAAPPAGAIPPRSGATPTAPGLPTPGAGAGDPPSLAPGTVSPGTVPPTDIGSGAGGGGDLTPLPQPQLADSGFATIDNCSCISAPSSYSAASGIDCGAPAVTAGPSVYTPPPARIPEPAIMPPAVAPPPAAAIGAAPTGAPARSLITLGQQLYPVEVGQGLWGQPVAYVPGQHVRNWIRYMSP